MRLVYVIWADAAAVTYAADSAFQGKSWRQWPGWWQASSKIVREVLGDLVVAKVIYGAPLALAHQKVAEGGAAADSAASLQREFVGRTRNGVAMLTAEEEAAVAIHLPPRALLGNFYTAVFHPDPLEWCVLTVGAATALAACWSVCRSTVCGHTGGGYAQP
jgi:hypothetical protein